MKKRKGPPKPATAEQKQAARKLDQASRKFNAAVENLRDNLEAVGGCLYELLAAEAVRERRRRFVTLANAGVPHDLQTLAAALEELQGSKELPPSLAGVYRYAHVAMSQLARTFEVQPILQPGEELMVQESQQAEFDWSADLAGDLAYPQHARVLRCGWRCGSEVLVMAKLTRVAS